MLKWLVRGVVRRVGALAQPLRPRARGLLKPITRARFLARMGGVSRVLEIGPFDEPLLKGEGVAYFDVLDQESLRRRAVEHKRNPDGCPPIDYVSPTGDLDMVEAKFDAIFSSHNIEHQPDLIGHLKKAEARLDGGGRYWLIIPDKRYCFDHFSPETHVADILQAHRERRTTHSPASIVLNAMLTHNDSLRHWLGFHGAKPRAPAGEEEVRRVFDEIDRTGEGEYIDVHAWRFTPKGFRDIIEDLRRLGTINFEAEQVFDTAFGAIEFCAVLRLAPPKERAV